MAEQEERLLMLIDDGKIASLVGWADARRTAAYPPPACHP